MAEDNDNRYIFVKGGDDCPEGTQKTTIEGVRDTYCRSTCGKANNVADCTGYPGVSIDKDGNINVKSNTPWSGAGYFKTGKDGCYTCLGNSCVKNTLFDSCCNIQSEVLECPIKDQTTQYYDNIKYVGDNCDVVCDKDQPDCVLRMPTSKNCGTPPPVGKKYKCAVKGQPCKEDPSGDYDDKTRCDKECAEAPPSDKIWDCKDGICQNVGAGKGKYNSQTECEDDSSTDCYTGGGGDTGNGKGGSKIIMILSILAGIIVLAIIGMFVYLFITGKKSGNQVGSVSRSKVGFRYR